MILFIILFSHFIGNYCVHSIELTSVVETDKGPVQGEIFLSVRRSIPFSSFRGIRYGKPPTGYSRFKSSEEAESWSEIFDATAEGTPCPQIDPLMRVFVGDEDCLHLNVYTPRVDFENATENLLPVMVWIFGGAFKNGNKNMSFYGPDILIENDVVVVAMSSRLGILGFLSLNLPGATGNAGLKDQQLALKWVQKNIEQFGGDPNRVTIFGDSSGAASVDYHVLADKSQGLFHRSISMSASPLSPWAFSLASEAEERAHRLGRVLGINATNNEELLEELYNQSAYDLVMAAEGLTLVDTSFKPTLEDSRIAGDEAFLSECSVKKYMTGNFMQVPQMHGFQANETLSFLENLPHVKDRVRVAIDAMEDIQGVGSDDTVLKLLSFFEDILGGVDSLEELDRITFQNLVRILSAVEFISGIDMKQKYLASSITAPIYYYRNSFAPYPSIHRYISGVNVNGAGHGDDVAYCWYISLADFPTDPRHPFAIMQERISRMWTNFAKYANPTPLGKNDTLLNISWPVSGLNSVYLAIDEEFSIGKVPIDQLTQIIEDNTFPSLSENNGC